MIRLRRKGKDQTSDARLRAGHSLLQYSIVFTYQHGKCLYSIGKYMEWQQQSPEDDLHLRGSESSEVSVVSKLVLIESTKMK